MLRSTIINVIMLVFAFQLVAETNSREKAPKIVSTWQADHAHSGLNFRVRHLGIARVQGKFKQFNVKVNTDIALEQIAGEDNQSTDLTKLDFSNTKVSAVVDTSSFNTENDKRDAHMKGEEYLDTKVFPKITFDSTSFKNQNAKSVDMVGKLTMHGVTKEVVLKIVDIKKAKSPQGNYSVGLEATTSLSRKDFGIISSPRLIGDEIQITIDMELMQDPFAFKMP